MGNTFSPSSLERLETCDWRLQEIDNKAITNAPWDYGIACGYRSSRAQQEAYDAGKSDAKPGQSKHNTTRDCQPNAEANDIFLWYDGRAWWGDEDLTARSRMREVMRYREGIAYALGHPINVMPTLKDGTEDLGHAELA
jgi:hypothetical protein